MTNKLRQWTTAEKTASQKAANAWTAFSKRERGEQTLQRGEAIAETAQVTAVQEKHEAELLAMDNVVGVAASRKVKAGKPTNVASLTVLVSKKVDKAKVSKASTIPDNVDGVKTDVVEVGDIEALAFNTRVRPALPGFSIGHYNITAGTFGALVRDVRRCCCKIENDCEHHGLRQECDGDILILSNNHVLANENQARPGDNILQPGPFDGGLYPSDTVATFERTEEIVFGASGYNLVDAAVARPTDSRNVTPSILGLVAPNGVGQALPFENVVKVGRTTEVTTGVVLATNATVAVGFSSGVAVFRHQILTTAMAAGGDSGSLLMDFNLNGVGLLFAGSPIITIHNHLLDVQNALGVELVTAPI